MFYEKIRNRFQNNYALIFLFLLFFSNSGNSQEPLYQPKKDFAGETAYEIIRIIDGDTVVISLDGKATTIRLIGVDTPETVPPLQWRVGIESGGGNEWVNGTAVEVSPAGVEVGVG